MGRATNSLLHLGDLMTSENSKRIGFLLLAGRTPEQLGYISTAEYARLHHYNRNSIANMARQGRLPALPFHGDWYILLDASPLCPDCGQPRERWRHYCSTCAKARKAKSNRKTAKQHYHWYHAINRIKEVI